MIHKNIDNSFTKINSNFILDGNRQTFKLPSYNPLKDKNLNGYFQNKTTQKYLIQRGILRDDGIYESDKEIKNLSLSIDKNQSKNFKMIGGKIINEQYNFIKNHHKSLINTYSVAVLRRKNNNNILKLPIIKEKKNLINERDYNNEKIETNYLSKQQLFELIENYKKKIEQKI